MKKALRVGYNQYYTDAEFEKHLAYVTENLDVLDEIAMFTEFSHEFPQPQCSDAAEADGIC